MRPIIQEALEKFSGQDVFIVGGGNSLKNFNFGLLSDKKVIAINAAYRNVGADAMLFWCDGGWVAENERGLKDHPSKLRFMPIINADVAIKKNLTGPSASYYLKRTGDHGYDPNIDNVKGNNSGCMAINFALNLKPRRIILLGFDLGYVAGKSHYHDHHTTITQRNVYDDLFMPSFNALAEQSKYLGIEIVNCSLESKLKSFTIGDISKFI